MIKKKLIKQCLAGFLSLAMTVTLFPAGALGTVQAEDAPQPALHYDMSHANGKLTDVSGNSHDGALKNFTDADFATEYGDTALNFDGTEKYVEIPSGVIKGDNKEAFTIEIAYTDGRQDGSWLLTLGTTVGSWPDVKNYLFVSPYSSQEGYNGKMLAAIKNGETELRYDKATALTGDAEGKNIVTVVFDNGNVTYYLNGAKAKTTESGYKIQDILKDNSTDTCIGYIGKSLYSGDKYFKGSLSDFKVYETALTEAQVTSIHNEKVAAWETEKKVLRVRKALLETMLNGNKGIDEVSTDLAFPAERDGVSLTWTSSKTDVVAADGKVHATAEGQKVIVKVVGTLDSITFEEEWELNVITEEGAEYQAFEDITIPNADDIKGNVTLLAQGAAGSPIVWESSNAAVISPVAQGKKPAGVVTRPDEDTTVKLTATLKQASGDKKKDFDVTVKKKAELGEMTDYVFAYFAGDGEGEQIFLASSRDGLDWEELNDGKPVLKSEMGTTGLRDPYILRAPEGDKFYLVATDLSIALANWAWGDVQRNGSQALMVWESDDLINWTNQRMAVVSAKIEAGCTWAPEVFYDDTTGEYMLFWSSLVKGHNYDKHRVYYVKTRDFYTFTDPQIWIENEFSTIDATVIKGDDGKYYRFCKNESNGAKYIYEEVADTLLGEWKGVGWTDTPNDNKIGYGEGPCCFRINDDDRDAVGANYCLLIDDFGGVRYYPMLTDDLASGKFEDAKGKANLPSKPCHGTVMNITKEEYIALTSKWGKPSLAADSIPAVVETGYTLPAEADVVYAGETKKVPVTWDKTADDFKEPGTVTVTGTFTFDGKEGTSTKTIEVITVSEDWIYYIDAGVGSWNTNKSQSAFHALAGQKADLRNVLPDQLYAEGSWGINNPKDSSTEGYANAGNRTSKENSLYANGWWAKGGKTCEYIIPLESGNYKATGYFQEWWNEKNREIDFYADYKNDAGETVTTDVISNKMAGQWAKWAPEIEFEVTGVTGTTEVHFYAKKKEGTNPNPHIAGLAIEKKMTADEKADLETKKTAARESLGNVTAAPAGDTAVELFIGSTKDIEVTCPDDLKEKAKAANMEVVTTYKSSKSRVASVDENGKVTAVAAGEAEITTTVALSSKISKSFTTKIQVKEIPVESVELSEKTLTLKIGENKTLTATVLPENATNKEVTWKSDNEAVATVEDGTVTAIAEGTANITATAGEKTATCVVTVPAKQSGGSTDNNPSSPTNVAVSSVTLNPNQAAETLAVGGQITFTAVVAPANATDKKVAWASSDPNVAAISGPDASGKVTVAGKKAGTAKITATAGGKTATCTVTVVSLSLNKTKLTMGKGEKFTLKVSGAKNVEWSSDNSAVAVKNGKLTAKKTVKKAVTITAKAHGAVLTCKVTVKNAPKKISLNAKSKTLKKGKTFKIKVKFPKNTASNKLTYKSSNSKVAKVDANGKIKAVKKGKATITVTTFNKKKAKIKITVK